MKIHHALIAVSLLLAVSPTLAQPESPPANAPVAPASPQPDPVSIEGWQSETFALPPAFAPTLPAGSESLRFAPGWNDPKAEGFWSYAFVMRINEPAPNAARVREILATYYDGLTSSFAAGKDKDISGTPAKIEIATRSPGAFEATMHLIDAFATFNPIDVRVLVESVAETATTSLVCIRLSPQPATHAIWRSLDAAVAELRAQGGAPREHAEALANNPMTNYARLVGDEWQLTAPGMKGQIFNTWHWGPGRHSARVMTDGTGADGTPWRAMAVHYWHPGHDEIRMLGLSPFERQVSEGTITFGPDGESAEGVFEIHQPRVRRKMGLRWAFFGPDKFHDVLLEASGPEGLQPLNQWDHIRAKAPNPPRSFAVVGAEPSERTRPLTRLLGVWESAINTPDAGRQRTQTKIEWIPLADGVYARVVAPGRTADATSSTTPEPTHLFDVYLYHHTGAKALRALLLSNQGDVYEGDITVLAGEGGALQLDLRSEQGDRTAHYAARFDFDSDDAVRQRIWSVRGTDLTPLLDTRHAKVERKGD